MKEELNSVGGKQQVTWNIPRVVIEGLRRGGRGLEPVNFVENKGPRKIPAERRRESLRIRGLIAYE